MGIASIGYRERFGGALAGFGGISENCFAESGGGSVARGGFHLFRMRGGSDGAAIEFARFGKLAVISGRAGFEIKQNIFRSRLAQAPGDLLGHALGIVFQESNLVEIDVKFGSIEIFRLGLFSSGAGLVRAIENHVKIYEVAVAQTVGRGNPEGYPAFPPEPFHTGRSSDR